MADEHRRAHVVTALQFAAEMCAFAAGHQARALLLADIDIGQDLLQLTRDACAPIIVSGSSGCPIRILATRATAFSMNLSKIDSCTSARDGQVHTSPLLNANSANPSSALSKNA